MPLNDRNFLMWFGPSESPYTLPLPRPYVREPEMISPVAWLVPLDEINYYINTLDNTALGGTIVMLHERSGATEHYVFHSKTTVSYPGGEHVYGTMIITDQLPEGMVRFKMGANLSQWFWLTTAQKAAEKTVLVKFRNAGRLGGTTNIRWAHLPDTWHQQFRIRLTMDAAAEENNKDTYRSATSGKTRHLLSQPRRIIDFLTPEYDYWGHQAVAAMLEHDTLLINNQPYAFQTGYKPNMTRDGALSDGQFSLSDEAAATLHRS